MDAVLSARYRSRDPTRRRACRQKWVLVSRRNLLKDKALQLRANPRDPLPVGWGRPRGMVWVQGTGGIAPAPWRSRRRSFCTWHWRSGCCRRVSSRRNSCANWSRSGGRKRWSRRPGLVRDRAGGGEEPRPQARHSTVRADSRRLPGAVQASTDSRVLGQAAAAGRDDGHDARRGVRTCILARFGGEKTARGDLFDPIKRPPAQQEPGCGADVNGQSCTP
jgi:hypothetical protein